jgi:hypothetical protein
MPRMVTIGRFGGLGRRVDAQDARIAALEERVADLQEELHDARAAARRTGEVADVVISLLTRADGSRDPEVQRLVESLVHEV